MDITLMATTMERDPPMLRLRPRPSQRHFMVIMVTLTVWATTLATLDTDTLVTPLLTVELPPPTPPWDTPWHTLPEVSPTPPTSVSAPTTSVPSSPARQTVSTPVATSSFIKFIEFLIKTKI